MSLEVLAVGELLVDFIGSSVQERMSSGDRFQPFPGGSPANLASNLRRLGVNSGLAATVGEDDLGHYLLDYAKTLGLDTSNIRQIPAPTTMILLTRSQGVPKFEAYRSADHQIEASQLPIDTLSGLKIMHTTCFALSKEPARSAILAAAKVVSGNGGQVSIDANYAQKIWPNQEEAQAIVAHYCAMGALVKFSDVDWKRLYGYELTDPVAAANFLHDLGAKIVCITLGGDGCLVSDHQASFRIPVRPIEVVDTTGAGDAFWAGFLAAYLKKESIDQCGFKGRALAEMKLTKVGPLAERIDYDELN